MKQYRWRHKVDTVNLETGFLVAGSNPAVGRRYLALRTGQLGTLSPVSCQVSGVRCQVSKTENTFGAEPPK